MVGFPPFLSNIFCLKIKWSIFKNFKFQKTGKKDALIEFIPIQQYKQWYHQIRRDSKNTGVYCSRIDPREAQK